MYSLNIHSLQATGIFIPVAIMIMPGDSFFLDTISDSFSPKLVDAMSHLGDFHPTWVDPRMRGLQSCSGSYRIPSFCPL